MGGKKVPQSSGSYSDGIGRAYLVYGRTATTPVSASSVVGKQAGWIFDGLADYNESSFVAGTAGDFNGDGATDFSLGGPGFNMLVGRGWIVNGCPFE